MAHDYRYYWATHQAEYATDVLFTSRTALHALYARLLRHATLCLRAEDVLTFLGRKLHGGFAGEILNDWKRRWPGARVKHWMKANWIKMYDKHGCVLRVETVINDPYEFKVRRRAGRRGRRTLGWHPLPKGVASGTYSAPPVRRVHIPKGDGSQVRPIGIPTFEDKILQRAVSMVLEAVYEQDFLDCSYGFRPGRSAHQALEVLREGLMTMGGGWMLEVDIRSFFDTLDHGQLRAILRKRVQDGVLRRLIGKWLHAGAYGITGNSAAITRFRYEVRSRWRKWLNRRGGRSHISWPQFHRLEERYLLPAAIAVHSSYRRAANP